MNLFYPQLSAIDPDGLTWRVIFHISPWAILVKWAEKKKPAGALISRRSWTCEEAGFL
jgi:hypothetical protein